MKIEISKKFIEQLTQEGAHGQTEVTLNDLKKIANYLDDKRARAVKINNWCSVVFYELSGVEFKLLNFSKKDELDFLTRLEYVDATMSVQNFVQFIFNEIFQGNGFGKLLRAFEILIPLLILNTIAYMYGTRNSLSMLFSGLLISISIFIAIFSLFTVSHEYLARKKLSLFESGKLGYYFSVDKHLTTLGIFTIIISLFGTILIGEPSVPSVPHELYSPFNSRNTLLIIAMNFAFFGVFVVLRSIKEFYVGRPGKFILGDLKQKSLRNFDEE